MLTITRGAALTWPIKIEASNWSDGDILLFGAKVKPDDDVTDANAKLKKTLTNEDVTSTDADYVYFDLVFTGGLEGDTDVTPGTYVGEFKHVFADGDAEYFDKFPVTITSEINRRMS